MPRVLLLETIDDEAMRELEQFADVTLAGADHPVPSGPTDAIMTRGKGRVDAGLIDRCTGLRAIARCGVGLDNVDVSAASARGIPVLNLPACNARTIVEHTLMLMLAVSRGLVESARAVRRGDWASRATYDRDELAGRTLGVIGLGNIGQRVATVSAALGMQVLFTDPTATHDTFERVELDDLLDRSDVVTLHCSLTDGTRDLLDQRRLARMKRGAILINTARGALIDHAALADALASGDLAGFGADVLDVEPPAPDLALLELPHVVITPHVGSLTRSTYRAICVRSVRNVAAILDGRDPEPGTVFNAGALGRP